MDTSKAFIDAVGCTFPMFQLTPTFQGEAEEKVLASANQINTFISFTDGLKGTVVAGFTKATALKLVSAMMGGMEVTEFDEIAESAIAELMNMLVGSALNNLGSKVILDISPPTVANGDRMFLMLSRVKSIKLLFKLDNETFSVSYAIE